MKILLLALLLLFSCGKRHNVKAVQIEEGKFLLLDAVCVGVLSINKRENQSFIHDIKCKGYNFITRRLLSEELGIEYFVRNGEPVFILPLSEMIKIQEFLAEKGVTLEWEE